MRRKIKYAACLAAALAICMASGCSGGGSAQDGEAPDPTAVLTSEPAQTPSPAAEDAAATPAGGGQEGEGGEQMENADVFAMLYPDRDSGSIKTGKEINRLAGELADNIRARLTEITYTYKGGKISMEVLAGNRDSIAKGRESGNDIFDYVYDESEYYNYVLYLPEGYDPKDTETKWPVIYFFHGIGEKGSDLTKLISYGVPRYIMDNGGLDAIMIAPQCPEASHWADTDVEEPRLRAFVEENLTKYNIDADRMYLTGLSMGGRCTWKQALAMPDAFAAVAVVCGRTNTYDFSQILDMPVWMFHGAVDDTVAFQNINRIVTELYGQGHEYFKLTVYPYLSHDSWTPAYARPDLYEWLLAQNLKNRGNGGEE